MLDTSGQCYPEVQLTDVKACMLISRDPPQHCIDNLDAELPRNSAFKVRNTARRELFTTTPT